MLNNHRSILLAFVVMFSVATWAQTESKNRTPSIAVNSVYKGYRILYEDVEGVFLAEKHGKLRLFREWGFFYQKQREMGDYG